MNAVFLRVGDFGISRCYASFDAGGPLPNFHCDDDWNTYQCMYDVGDCCDSVIRAEQGCTDCVCVEDGLVHPIQRKNCTHIHTIQIVCIIKIFIKTLPSFLTIVPSFSLHI